MQYPNTFPPHHYWTSSLVVPWWVNKRQVRLPEDRLPNPPFATFTRGYVDEAPTSYRLSEGYCEMRMLDTSLSRIQESPPDHLFQVPCDTITPSSERYQKTGTIEIIR